MISKDRELCAAVSRIREATDLGSEHHVILVRLAYKCLGRGAIRSDAEDLASTVTVHLVQHLARGGVVERFLPWAMAATQRAVLSLRGRTSHRVESFCDPRELDRHASTAGRTGGSLTSLPPIAELAPLFLAFVALARRQKEYLKTMAKHPGATQCQLARIVKMKPRDARDTWRSLLARLKKAVDEARVPGLMEELERRRLEAGRERERERVRGPVAERCRGDSRIFPLIPILSVGILG